MEKKLSELYEFRHNIADELLKAYGALTRGTENPNVVFETFFNDVKELYLKGAENE